MSHRLAIAGSLVVSLCLATAAFAEKQKTPEQVALEKENEDLQKKLDLNNKRLYALKNNQGGAFERNSERLYGKPKEEPEEKTKTDFCNPQRLFVRADSLDNFLYTAPSAAKAKGASVSFLDDRVSGQRTVSIDGTVSYVLFRDLCPTTPKEYVPFISGWAIAPFISGNGTITSPKSKKEESSTKVGVEAQFELSRGFSIFGDFPLRQVFTVAPYFQSDFRGVARASGVNGYWDVYDLRYHLGGYINTDPNLGWFVQLRGETDFKQVDEAGLTGLTQTSYNWAGGTARVTFMLFPLSETVAPWLRDRFSIIGSVDAFHDFRSGMDIHQYKAALKYKLNPEGYSSVAFEYTNGTDKDTLVNASKYMVKLLYAE